MTLPTGRWSMPFFPATAATNATSTAYLDTLGYDFAVIDICGPTHAANNLPATVTLYHGTTTVATNGTAIEAFTGGTSVVAGSTGFVIPASTTVVTSGYCIKMLVDCRVRERYLGLAYTSGTAATHQLTVVSNLFRAENVPDSAADARVNGLVTE